jgi:hypothetical protein
LKPPANYGVVGTPFGQSVAEVDINWLDTQLLSLLVSLGIQPNQLPIFLTYDTYLTDSGCCIGGYHSAVTNVNGTQAYAQASYIDQPGNFAEDVSALSHEVGEWMDDPLVTNNGNQVACGTLEVGDPEEGFSNYGTFQRVSNGFTYNLQDLVFLGYFGAPKTTSVNSWITFRGNPFGLGVCSNGG